jgi:hypothetical protein
MGEKSSMEPESRLECTKLSDTVGGVGACEACWSSQELYAMSYSGFAGFQQGLLASIGVASLSERRRHLFNVLRSADNRWPYTFYNTFTNGGRCWPPTHKFAKLLTRWQKPKDSEDTE